MAYASFSLAKTFAGPILDLGGGGEGVIGRIYCGQAVAIDNRQEELDEAPDGPKKLLMDAADLAFQDSSFQHVTAFFSFMYMDHTTQAQAISEAARVLRPGGSLHIWDGEIRNAFPDPYLMELDINAAGAAIHTTYGILKENAFQNAEHFIRICRAAHLKLEEKQEHDGWFYLHFSK